MSRERARALAGVLLGLLAADLAVLIVSGSHSLLPPFGGLAPVQVVWRAAAIGALALVRFRLLAPRGAWPSTGALVLGLLLLPALVQFHVAGGRINGDGLSYYVFVRSLLADGDFDLENEYTHYGMIGRGDLQMPTRTGLRRSIYSIGPAVVWTPFYLAGEGLARAAAALGAEVDLSGYGPHHRNAVALGSLLYGFCGLVLVFGLLRRYFRESTALGAVLLVWGGTFLHWYMVWQPTYSHAASFWLSAYGLWLWDRDRGRRTAWGFFFLGAVLGLAMCVRWQNGVLLALPGLELLERLRREPRALAGLAGPGALLAAGALLGAAPQMIAWQALYGEWLLRDPPHGADFLRLDHPFALETLFSSRHGLLSWTPVFWAGFVGLLVLARRRPRLALPLLPLVAAMTYVNMCSGDWWAGASFSNRRFDSLVPMLAFGVAASVDVVREAFRRRPQLALAALAVPVVLWNALLAEQARRALIPRDDVVGFWRLTRLATELLSAGVGFPTTWPASWLFAAEHDLPPDRYDRAVGKYLFYRQNNLGGHVPVGTWDDALLGEGWGRPERHLGRQGRRLRGEARVLAPLDVPLDLELRLRAVSLGEPEPVRVLVNGREAGSVFPRLEWSDQPLRVPAPFWRRRLNDVVLIGPDDRVLVEAVVFRPLPGPA